MSEREALFEHQLKHAPEEALNDALFEIVKRQYQVIRVLGYEANNLDSAQANAWDLGFIYARDQFMMQKKDPAHPINRINPYREGEQA